MSAGRGPVQRARGAGQRAAHRQGGQEEGAGDIIQESGSALLTEDSTIVRTAYEETQNYLIVPNSVISVVDWFLSF